MAVWIDGAFLPLGAWGGGRGGVKGLISVLVTCIKDSFETFLGRLQKGRVTKIANDKKGFTRFARFIVCSPIYISTIHKDPFETFPRRLHVKRA